MKTIKYLLSVLTSTTISICFIALFTFLSTKEVITCNEYSQFPMCFIYSNHVEKESFTLNDRKKLAEIKAIIEDYLSGSIIEKLEDDTVEFLQNILNNVNVKLELLKGSV